MKLLAMFGVFLVLATGCGADVDDDTEAPLLTCLPSPSEDDAPDVGFQALLRSPAPARTPIEGAAISVTTPAKDRLGCWTSNAEGFVYMPISSSGEYELTLILDTLPAGLTVTERATIVIKLDSDRRRTALFALREG